MNVELERTGFADEFSGHQPLNWIATASAHDLCKELVAAALLVAMRARATLTRFAGRSCLFAFARAAISFTASFALLTITAAACASVR